MIFLQLIEKRRFVVYFYEQKTFHWNSNGVRQFMHRLLLHLGIQEEQKAYSTFHQLVEHMLNKLSG